MCTLVNPSTFDALYSSMFQQRTFIWKRRKRERLLIYDARSVHFTPANYLIKIKCNIRYNFQIRLCSWLPYCESITAHWQRWHYWDNPGA